MRLSDFSEFKAAVEAGIGATIGLRWVNYRGDRNRKRPTPQLSPNRIALRWKAGMGDPSG